MNAKRMNVYSVLGLACLLLTQPSCAMQSKPTTSHFAPEGASNYAKASSDTSRDKQTKEPASSQLPQQKTLPTQQKTQPVQAQKEISAKKPVADAPQKQSPATRMVTFKNNIKPAQLAYHYAPFINPKPSIFTVSINGQQINPGQEKAIAVTDNKIKAQYYFAFGTRRNGTRAVEYTIKKDTTHASFTFAWDKKIRITIEGETPMSAQELVVS